MVLPPGTRVLAGELGLSRTVTWARVLRPRPPALDPPEGGELILLASEALQRLDPVVPLARLVERLAALESAALAVDGAVEPTALAAAEAANLPLLGLPAGQRLPDLERAVVSLIVDRRGLLYRRSAEVGQALAALAIRDPDVPTLIDHLAALTGRAVALRERAGRLHVAVGPGQAVERNALARLLALTPPIAPSDNGAAAPMLVSEPSLGLAGWAMALTNSSGAQGTLLLYAPDGGLGELDRLILTRAAGVVTAALSRAAQTPTIQAQGPIRGFLRSLFDGTTLDEAAIRARAVSLGLEPGASHLVVLARGSAEETELWAGRLDSEGQGWWLPRSGAGELVGVWPQGNGGASGLAERVLASLQSAVDGRLGRNVWAGLSRPHPGLRDLPTALKEANQAQRIAARTQPETGLLRFDDLGTYRLWGELMDTEEAVAFTRETLGVLASYDAAHDGVLLDTLDAFFRCHGNVSKIADTLGLHRNTVVYRLGRIEEIASISLDDPEGRLCLAVALKLWPVTRI